MPPHITRAKAHFFKNDSLEQVLHPGQGELGPMTCKTKIVATIGPASQSIDKLCELLEAGVTCARIDLTWAPIEYHRRSLQNLQEAMKRTRRLCAVMVDTLGRELMIKRKYGVDETGWPGVFEQLFIAANQRVVITTDTTVDCTNELLPVTYPKFPAMCQPGDQIFLGRYLVTGADDSSVFLEVEEATPTEVICRAKTNAKLDGLLTVFHQERSMEGLSNLQNDLPVLTDFDKQAIQILSSEFEVDFLSLSYCRSVEDVLDAREFLRSIKQDAMQVVAKCETRQSLLNYRNIVEAADGIIMSRGNLGHDVLPEKIAMIQKAMISTCAILGKFSIVTRVVDTMIKTPRPTRAEATDIANAVLDGVDAIMLGAETYRGQYPVECITTVAQICRASEEVFDHHNHFEHLASEAEYFIGGGDEDPELPRHKSMQRSMSHGSLASEGMAGANGYAMSLASLPRVSSGGQVNQHIKLESMASGVVKAADKVNAALIVVVTHTGKTANMVARFRPAMPILTLVVPYLKRDGLKWSLEGRSSARQALLVSGLMPVLAAPSSNSGEGLIEEAVSLAASSGLLKAHDRVAVLSRRGTDYLIKIVSMDELGQGIKLIRPPKSLLDILQACGCIEEDEDAQMVAAATDNGLSPTPTPVGTGPGTVLRRPSLARTSVLVSSKADALVFQAAELSKVTSSRRTPRS